MKSSSQFITKAAGSISRMFDALEKNKSLTNPIYGVPVLGNIVAKTFGSKDLGAFAADAANLQTQYANLDLTRPGIKAVEFYKQTKPDESANEKYNYGMILANAQKIQDTWEIDKNNWEEKFPNTKFPIPNPNMNPIINKIKGIKNFDSDVPDQAQMEQQMPSGTQYDFAGRPIKQQTTATQETIPEKLSAGSKILAKDLEIPEFDTEEEFLNYYNQQPKTVQNAIKLKYQGGK